MHADAAHHPDLFWAVRGAGGNFGVVTAFELVAPPVEDVVVAVMLFDDRDIASLIERFDEVMSEAPRELTSFLYAFTRYGASQVVRVMSVYAGAEDRAAADALQSLLRVGRVRSAQATRTSYADVVPPHDAPRPGGPDRPPISNGFAERLTSEIAGRLAQGLRTGAIPLITLRSVGGAVNDVDATATAYAHRHQRFNIQAAALGGSAAAFDAAFDELRPHLDGLYLSFETDPRPERLHDAFPGAALARLRDLKAKYDPDQIFNQNFAISR